jgi:hypothetical protein
MQVEQEIVGVAPPLEEIGPDAPTEDTFPFHVAADEIYVSEIAAPIHWPELFIVETDPM